MNWMALTKAPNRRTFIVGTEAAGVSWVDVRSFAARMLGVDPYMDFDTIETTQTRPDAILRWTGSDAGSPPTRELEVKFRAGRYGEAFGEWMPIRLAEAPEWMGAQAPAPAKTKKGRPR